MEEDDVFFMIFYPEVPCASGFFDVLSLPEAIENDA
jgi:hypothetical protein